MVNSGPELLYSNKWLRTLYDHATYLRTREDTQVIQITPQMAFANRFNIAGLLNDLRVPQEDHYLIAIVNGWDKDEDLDDVQFVFIPSQNEVARLRKLLPAT